MKTDKNAHLDLYSFWLDPSIHVMSRTRLASDAARNTSNSHEATWLFYYRRVNQKATFQSRGTYISRAAYIAKSLSAVEFRISQTIGIVRITSSKVCGFVYMKCAGLCINLRLCNSPNQTTVVLPLMMNSMINTLVLWRHASFRLAATRESKHRSFCSWAGGMEIELDREV